MVVRIRPPTCGLPVAILELVVYRDPTGCLTAFYFSPFEVRDDSNPSGDGLSHLNRINLGGAATHDLRDCRVVKAITEKRGHGARTPDTSEDPEQGIDGADLAFQDADQTIACLHGGASTCSSRRGLKHFRREVCVATPALEACQPLKWSEVPITFSRVDHPESTKGVGRLPIIVTPTRRNVKVRSEEHTSELQSRPHLVCRLL